MLKRSVDVAALRPFCALALGLLLVGGCDADDGDDGSADDATDEDTGIDPSTRPTARGTVTCEINELTLSGDQIAFNVWNSQSFHDCPDEWVEATKATGIYGIAGPWRLSADIVDQSNQPETPTTAEMPPGSGFTMGLAAQVNIGPISQFEQAYGVTIETADDIPQELYDLITNRSSAGAYTVNTVERNFTSTWTHYAGNNVYFLNDGTDCYAMKLYTASFEPSLTDESAVAELGSKYQELPEGWSFEVKTFAEDFVVSDAGGTAYVVADEFGNSFDRADCS